MYRHIHNEHGGLSVNVEFEWGICGKFVKPFGRQLNEAICIENTNMQSSLNTKGKYFHQNIRKIGITEQLCNNSGIKFENEVDLKQHRK